MKRALPALALLFLLAVPARAEGLAEALDTDGLTAAVPPEAAAILGDAAPDSADLDAGLESLWAGALRALPDALADAARPLAAMVAVVLLSAAAEAFTLAAAGTDGYDSVQFAGCLAIAVIGAQDVHSVLALGRDSLAQMQEFSHILLPTLTAAAAAAGSPGAAGAVWAAAALFSDVLLTAANGLVLPLISGFTAAACAAAVLGQRRLDGASGLLQWAARALLKALTLAFTAYLALTKTLGAAADAAAVRTAKAVISNGVPVVGRMLSDAAEAMVAGAELLRLGVGVYGMLAVLAALLLPLLRLTCRWLLFRAAAALTAGIAGERQGRLIAQLGTAYSLLVGLLCAGAAIAFLAVLALIRTVTP